MLVCIYMLYIYNENSKYNDKTDFLSVKLPRYYPYHP